MASASVSHSVTIRLELPARPTAVSELTTAMEQVGAIVTALDVTASGADRLQVDVTAATRGEDHAEQLTEALRVLHGVQIGKVSDRVFLAHLGGKLEIRSKVPLRTRDDLSLAYTPGVGRVSLAIAANPEDARRLTIKRNTVAVVTDGSAVLGPGQPRPARGAAGHGGQGGAVQAVRRHRRVPDLPGHPGHRGDHRRGQGHRPGLRRASTSRTSPRPAASRSSAGCARSSTSRCSTTTSTAPPSSCSPR